MELFKMVGTSDKKVLDAVEKHIISQMKGNGGLTAFINQINYMRMPVPKAIAKMVEGGMFLIWNQDIVKFLNKLGFTDDKKIENYTGYSGGPLGLYTAVMVNAGVKMYEKYYKTHKM